ncbi:MAG: cupin domain-containing protein [Dehalococcoidia bacterium]|jgi:mannose-6-phosphate isomerase-like protein (cupin superfamily)
MMEKLPHKTEKPWGYELLFALTPNYAGKLIFVKKGHRLSLQYHEKKDETMFLQEGKALLEIEVEGKMTSVTLTPGQSRYIPPHTKHRLQAIEDTTLFEVSTTELDDVVRLEDDYGRAKQ